MDEPSSSERWEARQPERPLRSSAAVTLIGGASYVGMLVSAVRSVVVMAAIGPERRGVQRWVQLLKSYLANTGIAFRHGVSKQLPMAVGAGDEERAAEIEDTGFTSVLVVSGLTALGMLVYALLFAGPDREARTAYAAGAGILLAEELVVLYFCVLRSWGNFELLAVADLVRTGAYFALVAGGAVLLGLTGVMVGWLVGALVVLAGLEIGSRLVVAIDLDWGRIGRLALVGLPVALISFSDLLLRSIDGTILVRYYGLKQFGLYSVAMQMAAYLFAIPQSAGFVIWPRVLESYGAEQDSSRTRRRVLAPTIAAAGVMPVLAGMAYLALPPVIGLLIPRFAESVPAAQVLGMGSVLLALPLATNSALVASNREALVIATKLAGAVLAGGLTWHLVTRAAPLEQVALAACLGFGLAAVLSLLVQLRDFYPQPAARLREVLLALLPLAWSVGALWSARRLVMMAGMEPVTVHGAVLALLAFVVLSAPCVIYAHLRTGAGHELLELLRGRFRH